MSAYESEAALEHPLNDSQQDSAFHSAILVPDTPPPIAEPVATVPRPSRVKWIWAGLCSASEWIFGFFSLLIGLSLLATIPIVQFLSLGYLLESSGRIVRTGRLRDGFVGVRKAARVGAIVLGTWIVLWPARLVSELWYSSYLLNGPSREAALWRLGLVLTIGLTVIHIVWAWFRGGKLRHFVWPAPLRLIRRVRQGGMYREARDATWDFVASLRIRTYFMLGAKGFLTASAWLFLPVSMLVLAPRLPNPAGVLLGMLGALSFAAVLIYLPFLQGALRCNPFHRNDVRLGRCSPSLSSGTDCILDRTIVDTVVCLATLSVEGGVGPARSGLAAESGVHRLHVPSSISSRLGGGSIRAD